MNQGTRQVMYRDHEDAMLSDQAAFFANPQVLVDEISPEMIDEIASIYTRGTNSTRAWDELDCDARAELRREIKSIVSVSLPVLLKHEIVNP